MTAAENALSAALYVVATPIGNLADLTGRAGSILEHADCIAAEDTRRTGQLLRHLGIRARQISLHEHNECSRIKQLLARVESGEAVALVSDAGTPLVSDPGQRLVQAAHARGLPVVPIPGASSVMAALSAAGLPADRFVFEGFPPSKAGARQKHLGALASESRTLVLFEAPHRLAATLVDLASVFGEERRAVLCRELTKRHETVISGTLAGLRDRVSSDADQQRGEIVLVIAGAVADSEGLDAHARHVLQVLLSAHSPSEAARLAAQITGSSKNKLYRWAVEQSGT